MSAPFLFSVLCVAVNVGFWAQNAFAATTVFCGLLALDLIVNDGEQ